MIRLFNVVIVIFDGLRACGDPWVLIGRLLKACRVGLHEAMLLEIFSNGQ